MKSDNQSIKERVADLVAQMTLEEKISQMVFDAPAIERLGIPAYNWWNEGLHGVGRAGVATVFPQAIGLAATWNPDLMQRVATTISDEARAKHHEAIRRGIRSIYSGLTYWSPNVNIFRDPRWGRGQETYGEDPYLSATMGVAFVRGLQGDDPQILKLVATPKHFAVHSGPELVRHRFDAVVSEREMRETYLPAFEACIKEGGAVSIMGAYNRVNGEPACASITLLQRILRQEWGFGGPDGLDGFVVSDCWAIRDIYEQHGVVPTAAKAAALAVENGCDLNCGSTYPTLLAAVRQCLVSEAAIDEAVQRLFVARFRLGMFDPPEEAPYAQIPYEVVNSPVHRELARQAARESIVLLKNEGGLLPLSKDIRSIAVIGPNADSMQALLGNYNGTPEAPVTPLEGIRRQLPPSIRLYYAQGSDLVEGFPTLSVIPSAYLRPDRVGGVGLSAAYYDGPDQNGEPALWRVDRAIDMVWKDTTPLAGQWGDAFAVRWTGCLVPPVSGTYRLGVHGFSGYRLFLEGKLLVEFEGTHHPVTRTERVELEAGRFYPIWLDFMSEGLDPQVQLVWAPPAARQQATALEVAEKADVVIAVMGISSTLEGEKMPVHVPGFSGGDRTEIALPRLQEELLQQIHRLGKPIVLVLLNGSALAIPWAAEQIPAILEAWYPGQEGGSAVADVLFGAYNPGGRLPVTVYRSLNDLPAFEDYSMEGRTYRYFRGEALYPFGHGLSYTSFEYSDLRIARRQVTAGVTVDVSVTVANTGAVPGTEVAQLYVRDSVTRVPRPLKELKAYKRVTLQPGKRVAVTFHLSVNQLAFCDDQANWVLEPGRILVQVGSSAADIRLSGEFEIAGRGTVPVEERVPVCPVSVGPPS